MEELIQKINELSAEDLGCVVTHCLCKFYAHVRDDGSFPQSSALIGEVSESDVTLKFIPNEDHSNGSHYEDMYYLYGYRHES